MRSIKNFLKKLLPGLFSFYHWFRAYLAAYVYGFPSKKMVVLGVTGTKGKSSTANFIWSALQNAGWRAGLIGNANLKIGDKEFLNPYHMTMLDPFKLHRLLRLMVKNGCRAAVIETTSEGLGQSRHKGVDYDILIFTNLTPEHIEVHGSFEKYREAKLTVFRELASRKRKKIFGIDVPKAFVVNADSPEGENFLKFPADIKVTYGLAGSADLQAEEIEEGIDGVSYRIKNGRRVRLKTLGRFNVCNSLPALAVCEILKLDRDKCVEGLEKLFSIPGRMEVIARKPFMVIVDYAHEPESLKALLGSVKAIQGEGRSKIILLIGATGGGRDKSKRPVMGEIGARGADYLVVSNDDPYDEDPTEIIRQVSSGAMRSGKKLNRDLFTVEDRREGIRKAVSLAQKDDFVLITGKGSEQALIMKDRQIPWDDRRVTREALGEIADFS